MRPLAGLFVSLAATGLIGLALASPARADLLITVDKAAQKMTVTVDGDPRYVWPVATGIARYDTPNGDYKPFRMERDHFSREWDDAPMPYSIFFTQQGHAIHGTNHKITGAPASHGCVRLSVAHAAILWRLVKEQKMANTRVELTGEIPSRAELLARRNDGIDDNNNNNNARAAARPAPQAIYTPDDDDDGPTPSPRVGRGWGVYREGGRTYYYRAGPDEVRRIYRRVYRYYRRFGGFPW